MLTRPIGYREGVVRGVGVTFVTSRGMSRAMFRLLGGGVEIHGRRGRRHLKVRDGPVVAA